MRLISVHGADPPAISSPPVPAATRRTLAATLARDRLFLGFAAASFLLELPVGGAAHQTLRDLGSDILLLAALSWLAGRRLGSLPGRERRFWQLWSAALACWLLIRVSYAALPMSMKGGVFDLASDTFYMIFYSLLILAAMMVPHQKGRSGVEHAAHRLQLVGSTMLVFVLVIYFGLIPGRLKPELYLSWLPSFDLYIALDMVLAMLYGLLARTSRGRWALLYGLLAATTAGWAVLDLLEGLSYAGRIDLAAHPWSGQLWNGPLWLLVAALRSRDLLPAQTAELGPRVREPDRFGSPLLLAAVALPGMHVALHALGLLDRDLQPTRELLVLIGAVALTGVALVEHRLWRRHARAAEHQRQQLEAQLRQAQKMEAIGLLAGGIAHDFNNLMTVILGRTELLMAGADAAQQRSLKEIERTGGLATALTRQLLVFARPHDGYLERLDLGAVIATSAKTLLQRLLSEKIEVEVTLTSQATQVLADPGQIEQVMLNLALNAQDAMPDGGRLRITTEVCELSQGLAAYGLEAPAGSYVCLKFTDEGSGISEGDLPHIFDPFFSTKAVGTGLGLATVYGIVRRSAGVVAVETEPGAGTRFSIFFPIGATSSAQANDARAPRTEPIPASPNPSTDRSICCSPTWSCPR